MNARHSTILQLLGALAVVAVVSTASAQTPPPDGGAAAGRYTYTATSTTVTDTKTGLIWQRAPAGILMTQGNAKIYCTGLSATLAGNGWRLPTMKELLTLLDYSQATAPMIDSNAFPSTPLKPFWSSSPLASSSNAWIVYFDFGNSSTATVSSTVYVRCVR